MNHFEFALLLATLLFGGHSALHRWELRKTRHELLQRACRAPQHVARAWVEGLVEDDSATLWLQFTGRQSHMVAQGREACPLAVSRLRAAGISVESGAMQHGAPLEPDTKGLPAPQPSRKRSDFSPLA